MAAKERSCETCRFYIPPLRFEKTGRCLLRELERERVVFIVGYLDWKGGGKNCSFWEPAA